ncbi:MAG: type II toxin-antitoxin system VapC family toxin [Gaiellaceae bacterium]
MALVVLDASVFIAFRTRDDAHHQAARAALAGLGSDALVLPASAYAEVLVEPSLGGEEQVARARRLVDELPIRIEPVTRAIAERAAALRRHGRLPDALVLATGDELEADAVLTADRRWKRLSDRVRVI